MNVRAARIAGDSLLKGVFDVLDAMLSTAFDFTLEEPEALTEASAARWLGDYGVAMQGTTQNVPGAVALLFNVADAARFAALIQEKDVAESPTLSEDDRAMLKEIADPALGGGLTNFLERFGRGPEQLAAVSVQEGGAELADDLVALIGPGAGVRFRFSDSTGISGGGVILFSEQLEAIVPESALNDPAARELATEAELSPEEMNDILSGFGGAAAAEAPSSLDTPAPIHGNLDMVLDIGLIATARLGHVEMPISEIMNLGPGSIIEVGHLVDEPVDLLVNGKLIARGDVVVVDEKFGLRITEIVSARARIESLR